MNISKSETVLERLEGIIHVPVQKQDKQIDLTLNEIYKISNRGKLDFGGSEFQPSDTEKINPEKKDQDDDYGWWSLDKGIYLIKYNEKITSPPVYIQPHKRLIRTGSYTTNRMINEKGKVIDLIIVGEKGVDIKENARIASAYNIE